MPEQQEWRKLTKQETRALYSGKPNPHPRATKNGSVKLSKPILQFRIVDSWDEKKQL